MARVDTPQFGVDSVKFATDLEAKAADIAQQRNVLPSSGEIPRVIVTGQIEGGKLIRMATLYAERSRSDRRFSSGTISDRNNTRVTYVWGSGGREPQFGIIVEGRQLDLEDLTPTDRKKIEKATGVSVPPLVRRSA